MAVREKAKKFDKIIEALEKKSSPKNLPDEDTCLDQFIHYILYYPNSATSSKRAYKALLNEHDFADWNEVRVATLHEIATALDPSKISHAFFLSRIIKGVLEGIWQTLNQASLDKLGEEKVTVARELLAEIEQKAQQVLHGEHEQRREDAGEKVTIPVPPKYGQGDFAKTSYWRARGKLDVPKERFIAYPGVAREGDPTPVLGWAGWSHRDQALALAREIPVQQALGSDDVALEPLVAGLVELEPWLAQWHSEIEPQFGASPAAVIAGVVDQCLARMEKTREQVTEWKPPAATRGRRPSR